MKILCISPGYWPVFKHGGPIFAVHGLNKTLVKKGVDVSVYATNGEAHIKLPVNREINIEGVKVTYFRFIRLFEFIGDTGWQFSFGMAKALKANIKTFDLIHINAVWNFPAAIATYYCRKYSKPYIISPRGVLYPYTLSKDLWKKLIYLFFIAKKNLEKASAIHYATADEAKKCHSYLGLQNKTIIVPNGINETEFVESPSRGKLINHYPILKDKKVILFLGRINWKKGLDILAKAYGQIAGERKDVHLLIVGIRETVYEEKVKMWFKKENVLDTVTFIKPLMDNEKLEVYNSSDIFVLPSYSENFGMAVVEAMACKLPVIITNQVGLYPDVNNYRAGIVTNCDAAEVAKAILALLDNESLRKTMGENGRRLVEDKFALDKVGNEMIKMFIDILNNEK